MKAVGIILSNIHDGNVPELTSVRSMASIPFGGRYRLIDFTLSNMVNSGIRKVGIITKNNYRSLMDHIGSGRDWDLVRKNGGLYILPPFFEAQSNSLYETRLEALSGIQGFLEKCREDYVVLSDTDAICNLDFQDVLDFHIKCDADVTCVYKEMKLSGSEGKNICVIKTDAHGNVSDISVKPPKDGKTAKCIVNIWVMKRTLLIDLVRDAVGRDKSASFELGVVGKNLHKLKVAAYCFEGYFAWITSLERYFSCSMDLLKKEVRDELFNTKHRAIYTKIRDSAPTSYRAEAQVSNSLIADGCVIDGRVENSVVFRGVHIGKGSVVKNSVLMQDTVVTDGCTLDCVIADKNAVIKSGRQLVGCDVQPYFIAKNKII